MIKIINYQEAASAEPSSCTQQQHGQPIRVAGPSCRDKHNIDRKRLVKNWDIICS